MRPSRASLLAILAGCGGAPSAPGPAPCPTAPVRLAGPEQVAAFATCTTAAAITIRTGAPLELRALAVESIAGDLVVGPTFGIEELALTRLRRVGGAIRIASNANLRGLFLPALEEAGAVDIGGNVALTTISLPRLAAVTGAFAIVGSAELELLDASKLVAIGGELALVDNPELGVVELAALARARSTRIENNRSLDPEVVEALRKAAP